MNEAIGWILKIHKERNFQLLGASICLGIALAAVFTLQYVPRGIPGHIGLILIGMFGIVAGITYVAVEAAEGVSAKNTLRFILWVSIGSLAVSFILSKIIIYPVVGSIGVGMGYGFGVMAPNDGVLLCAAWNLLLLTVIGTGVTVFVFASGIAPEAIVWMVVAGAIIVGAHDVLADELGVTFR